MFDIPQTPTSPAFQPPPASTPTSTTASLHSTTATTLSSPPPSPQFSPPRPTVSSREQFHRHVNHLTSILHPLFSVTTGRVHPAFPRNLLQYHTLTEAQLDDLAEYYHQRTPCAWSKSYPAPVVDRWGLTPRASLQGHMMLGSGSSDGSQEWVRGTLKGVGVEVDAKTSELVNAKRRRFGRFVGLRGCESPVEETMDVDSEDFKPERWEQERREREDEWESIRRWVDARVRKGLEDELEKERRLEKGF